MTSFFIFHCKDRLSSRVMYSFQNLHFSIGNGLNGKCMVQQSTRITSDDTWVMRCYTRTSQLNSTPGINRSHNVINEFSYNDMLHYPIDQMLYIQCILVYKYVVQTIHVNSLFGKNSTYLPHHGTTIDFYANKLFHRKEIIL